MDGGVKSGEEVGVVKEFGGGEIERMKGYVG